MNPTLPLPAMGKQESRLAFLVMGCQLCCFEQILEATFLAAVWPLTTHLKNHPSKMNKTTGEARKNSLVTFFWGLLHMSTPVLVYQQELIHISSVWTLDVVWRICWEWWMIGMDREKESGNSILSASLDVNDVNQSRRKTLNSNQLYSA